MKTLVLLACHQADHRRTVIPRFQSLRLVCKRFACSRRILQVLFKGIQFRADPDGFAAIQHTDVQKFAEHVKQVTFTAPRYSTAMTRDIFNEIVLAQTVNDFANSHDMWNGFGSYAYEHRGHQKFLLEHMEDRLPFSDEAIRTGYQKYQDAAKDCHDLLQSEQLSNTWTSILRAFHNCHTVRLPEPDFDDSQQRQPNAESAYPLIRPHRHDQVHRDEVCRRLAAPLGDSLFAASMDSLARAGITVRSLDVSCAMTGEFRRVSLPDLTQMQALFFRPRVSSIGADVAADGGYQRTADRSAKFLNTVMQKCSDELVEFTHDDNWCPCPMRWPADEVVQLPKIRRIVLGSGTVRSKNLRAWIQHMPSLEHLELRGSNSDGSNPTGWRTIFDAVKDHMEKHQPKRMVLSLDQVPAADWAEISMHQDLTKLEDRILQFVEEDMDEVGDIDIVLIRYMTGLAGWDNAATRAWLES